MTEPTQPLLGDNKVESHLRTMPHTEATPRHPIDGWEATNAVNPELGALRISHVPNSTLIGLFIRVDAIMFPLAYFRNWHAAHRFASWMEGNREPEPTLAQDWKAMMEKKIEQVDQAAGIVATLREGVAMFDVTNEAVVPDIKLAWPTDDEANNE